METPVGSHSQLKHVVEKQQCDKIKQQIKKLLT